MRTSPQQGGTRLKEHLTHRWKNVKKCPSVPPALTAELAQTTAIKAITATSNIFLLDFIGILLLNNYHQILNQ